MVWEDTGSGGNRPERPDHAGSMEAVSCTEAASFPSCFRQESDKSWGLGQRPSQFFNFLGGEPFFFFPPGAVVSIGEK